MMNENYSFKKSAHKMYKDHGMWQKTAHAAGYTTSTEEHPVHGLKHFARGQNGEVVGNFSNKWGVGYLPKGVHEMVIDKVLVQDEAGFAEALKERLNEKVSAALDEQKATVASHLLDEAKKFVDSPDKNYLDKFQAGHKVAFTNFDHEEHGYVESNHSGKNRDFGGDHHVIIKNNKGKRFRFVGSAENHGHIRSLKEESLDEVSSGARFRGAEHRQAQQAAYHKQMYTKHLDMHQAAQHADDLHSSAFHVSSAEAHAKQYEKLTGRRVTEETQIDELHNDTIRSYVRKAAEQGMQLAHAAGGASATGDSARGTKFYTKAVRRLRGIKAATHRLKNEEVINEVEVNDSRFQFAHGRKPRGKGSWFFTAHRGGIEFDKHKEGEDYIQTPHMHFADAKKHAQKWAKSKGHYEIHVAT